MRRLQKLEYPIKLDLGCGDGKITGYVGMDWQDFGQEIVWDINHGIPLPNDSVSNFHSSHFVEHIKEHEISNFIHELIRVCQSGATIRISCPHKDCIEAYFICHHSLWSEERIQGICAELKSHGLSLVGTRRDGINLTMDLTIIKK